MSLNTIALVLVGKTGNGKSATGNSILGENVFVSKRSLQSVTSKTQLTSTVTEDGRLVNVIDTPGLCDSNLSPDELIHEISRCIELTHEGIHGILLVLSTRNRFSTEEIAAVRTLETVFGDKIMKYMIIVFTGGDELEEEGSNLEDIFPGNDVAIAPLQRLLDRCENRKIVFDNKSQDEPKLIEQRTHLFRMVDALLAANGGDPYSHSSFQEAKARAAAVARQEELAKHVEETKTREADAHMQFERWNEEEKEKRRAAEERFQKLLKEQFAAQTVENQKLNAERMALEKSNRKEAEQARNKEVAKSTEEMTKIKHELEQYRRDEKEARERMEEELRNERGARERMEGELRNKWCMIL